MTLTQVIQQLIQSKKESDYWDFKKEPHDSNASLLHDILCLANSLHKGDRYLIIGVSDPKKGAEIIGLSKGQKNRKEQTNIIDFLRNLKFAGDIRPEVELHTIVILEKEVDVLIIFDNPDKPYYLVEDYSHGAEQRERKTVKAYHIYTRTNDCNTPINKSADVGLIEKMWKQRFGLDLTPIERMKLLLMKPDEWFKDIGNVHYAYHNDYPEFRIEFSQTEEFWEVYSFFFTNNKSYLGNAVFKYHTTTLFELEYMYCDEMRIALAVPEPQHLYLAKHRNWYYYYNLDELNGIFLYFITDGLSSMNPRGSYSPFLIFNNEDEKNNFTEFVTANEAQLDNLEPSFTAIQARKEMQHQGKESVVDPLFIDKVKQMYDSWQIIY